MRSAPDAKGSAEAAADSWLIHTGSDQGAKMPTAKLFWNGRSQAVRLPVEFRFEGDVVEIHREGKRVILEPARSATWPKGYWTSWGKVPADFVAPRPLGC